MTNSRLRLVIHGAVQGVGFRPCVYRLANDLHLTGWVKNSAQGVFIELEGQRATLEEFKRRLSIEKPPRSFIASMESSWLDSVGFTGFSIRPSDPCGPKSALILPDIATCTDCLKDILDPTNRRHLYPFTNCTNCGPRFSIIRALPYDRPNTSMERFPICKACRAEYEDPTNRRFHAQPNACPICGPSIELWSKEGAVLAHGNEALEQTIQAIRDGKIVAVKGLGGFHLMNDARNESTVHRLRQLKHREEKPFAVMFPSLAQAREHSVTSELEERLLTGPESPIVLLKKDPSSLSPLAASVSPGNPNIGAMLPYTPLHHLLLNQLQFPVVATSGNLSDEPLCTDEHLALKMLGNIADLFLVHNRPILRHVDDSIVRVIAGREMVIRRARGYAPLPIPMPNSMGTEESILGVGAHLKNTVALACGSQIFVSQHIGDLGTVGATDAFEQVINDFKTLYDVDPTTICTDLHPDYFSTTYARSSAAKNISIQHHAAHIYSCMAENELVPPVLGIAWDGTGYGTDGTVWGGEFLRITDQGFERVGHLRTFLLPGGDVAAREPRRSAVGLLYSLYGADAFKMSHVPAIQAFSKQDLAVLSVMLENQVNCPLTSSAGRLFDAVASIIGIRHRNTFEGQSAMDLEFLIPESPQEAAYALQINEEILDFAPTITSILSDLKSGKTPAEISTAFHNSMVNGIVEFAQKIGEKRVVLSGGCFQNRYMTEHVVTRLHQAGFTPYWHQRIPSNDGGIALGQVFAAFTFSKHKEPHVPRDSR